MSAPLIPALVMAYMLVSIFVFALLKVAQE
jgi:hypothetical protein